MVPNAGYRGAQKWYGLYQAALLELDPNKLQERIAEAEDAIRNCMADPNHAGDDSENQALADALDGLRDLRQISERERKLIGYD